MTYLRAVVKETLRRHTPPHFTLSHAVVEEVELGGYTIPAKANVEFYIAWVTEDPKLWEDPHEFRPERFLEGGDGWMWILRETGRQIFAFTVVMKNPLKAVILSG
ncbi:hypothetical protein Ancab_022697 [Ancistrocladus abbreviatus]